MDKVDAIVDRCHEGVGDATAARYREGVDDAIVPKGYNASFH